MPRYKYSDIKIGDLVTFVGMYANIVSHQEVETMTTNRQYAITASYMINVETGEVKERYSSMKAAVRLHHDYFHISEGVHDEVCLRRDDLAAALVEIREIYSEASLNELPFDGLVRISSLANKLKEWTEKDI